MTGLSFLTRPAAYPLGQPPAGVDVMWRAECRSYAYCIDPETDHWGSTAPKLELWWYRVKHRTACGARLENGKLVYTNEFITRRRWASPTPAEAVASLIARRQRQISILQRQLASAEYELKLAKEWKP